ncbi:unnamed protein product [Coccothraustes coccothraustes]
MYFVPSGCPYPPAEPRRDGRRRFPRVNTERTIIPSMLLVTAHAQCVFERPSRHPFLPAPHGRGAAETTIPSVPRGACACVALSSAILARVNAVAAAATKQTRARHWRAVGGRGAAAAEPSMYRARPGRWVLLPALPGAVRLRERGSSVSGTPGTRRPLTGPGQRSGPPPAGAAAPADAGKQRQPPPGPSLSFPDPGGNAAPPVPASSPRPGPGQGGRGCPGGGCLRASLEETLPPSDPTLEAATASGLLFPVPPSPPPLSCRSLPGPSPACPTRLRLLFFLYYPRRVGEMRRLFPATHGISLRWDRGVPVFG